jgi:hypothetical protein
MSLNIASRIIYGENWQYMNKFHKHVQFIIANSVKADNVLHHVNSLSNVVDKLTFICLITLITRLLCPLTTCALNEMQIKFTKTSECIDGRLVHVASLFHSSTLKKEVPSSETLVILCRNIRRHIPEGGPLHVFSDQG